MLILATSKSQLTSPNLDWYNLYKSFQIYGKNSPHRSSKVRGRGTGGYGVGGTGGTGVWQFTHKAVHTEGGAYTRWCTQKAVCSHRRSLVIEGATGKAVHIEGGTHTRRSTQKAVCSHRRSLVI